MKKTGLIIFAVLLYTAYSAHDIDFLYSLVGGEKESGDAKLSEWVHEVVLRYYGKIQPAEKFAILISEDLDGITHATDKFPSRAVNHPVNPRSSLGFEFTGLGRLQIKGFSQVFINSIENDYPVYYALQSPLADATMVQRFKNSADLYWEIPINETLIMANIVYNNLMYDYHRLGDTKEEQYDSDIWFNGSFTQSFHEGKFKIQCRGLGKHDINAYTGYNLAAVYAGVGSDFKLFKRRVRGTAELLPRYYSCSIMDAKGYADEFGAVSRVRVHYRIKPRLFLKGDVEYEVAPALEDSWYIKQRYEIALRKAWRNFSSIEAGGWGTFGTLFPRLCGYAAATITAIPRLDILPGIRAYWLWDENWSTSTVAGDPVLLSSGYSFLRTDMALMLRYRIDAKKSVFFRNFAFKGGAEYKIFDWEPVQDPPYVNTLRLFLGITNYL